MKKVGIITYFYDSTNYGGILQSYALCSKINNLGFIAEQISYEYNSAPKYIAESSINDRCFKDKIKKILNNPVYTIRFLLRERKYNTKKENFKKFVLKYIPHSKRIYTYNDIQESNNKYDIFICGSDQIWNPISMDSNFYLEFVNKDKTKIAYAASFGADNLSEEIILEIGKKLTSFEDISVRETTGVELLKKVKKNAVLVPDPVFLIEKKQWSKLALNNTIKEKYIFTYFLSNDFILRERVLSFAKRKKMIIVDMSPIFLFSKSMINESGEGPQKFLGYIMDASYVFTDSFHCTAFSLIFSKKFVVFKRKKIVNVTSNSRMEAVLKFMEMESNLVNVDDDFDSVIERDYIINEYKLSNYRSIGNNFIEKYLNNKLNEVGI